MSRSLNSRPLLLLNLLLFALHAAVAEPKPGTFSGSFALPEISGVAMINGRLLVVADDPIGEKKDHMIDLLKDGLAKLQAGKVIKAEPGEQVYRSLVEAANSGTFDEDFIGDLEDIAAMSDGTLFLTSSHSQSSKGKHPPKRQSLVRVSFTAEGEIASAACVREWLEPLLPEALRKSMGRPPGAIVDGKPDPGFNIEGMAATPEGDLLFGLRSPLEEGKAVLLRLKHVGSLFAPSSATPRPEVVEAGKLDLHGMGIRSLCQDPGSKGYWLIAGLSPDPDNPPPEANSWSVWHWDGKEKLVQRLKKAELATLAGVSLQTPEAIGIVPGPEGKSFLLLISDDSGGSTYAGIPLELLSH